MAGFNCTFINCLQLTKLKPKLTESCNFFHRNPMDKEYHRIFHRIQEDNGNFLSRDHILSVSCIYRLEHSLSHNNPWSKLHCTVSLCSLVRSYTRLLHHHKCFYQGNCRFRCSLGHTCLKEKEASFDDYRT